MKPRIVRTLWLPLTVALGWWASSCSPSGFEGQSVVNSVRILAASADEPYARPGDTVQVTVLAFDGRAPSDRATSAMNLTWVPVNESGHVTPCINPANDAYYACFPRFSSAAIGSAPVGAADAAAAPEAGSGQVVTAACPLDAAACTASLDAGVAAPVMATSQFTMPLDVVTSHPPVAGSSPYGVAFLFNFACTGQVQYVPPNPSNPNPQQPPIGCFDDAGNALGASDYVLGYTRVYSRAAPDGGYYDNANPVITGVHLPPCTLAVQGSVPSFVAPGISARCTPTSCPNVTFGAVVPESSWEVNPLDVDSNGNPRHEEIWANYFSTFGGFTSATRLLYDPASGAVSGSDTAFQPPALGPNDLHDGFIFAVVYDDRGGQSWVSIPTHVCSDSSDPVCARSACGDGG